MGDLKKISLIVLITIISIFLISCPDEPAPPGEENNLPTGSAGIGKTILLGETVSFEGSAEDIDDDSLVYQWSVSAVPVGSSITDASLSGATTLNASFTPDVSGDYTLEISISDGIDAITASTTVHVVSYTFGLTSYDNEHAGFIHDGELFQVTNPYPTTDECEQYSIILHEGTVYSTGGFMNIDDDYQAAYWTGENPTVIDDPIIGSGQYYSTKIIFDAGNNPEMMISDGSSSFYWKNSSGYLYEDDAITGEGVGMDYYIVTDIFRNGNDVIQIGAAMLTGTADHYFMALNNAVIVDDAVYDPDPISNPAFSHEGNLFVRGVTDTQSEIYLYGMYNTGSAAPEYRAGYIVNDVTGWQELYYDPLYIINPQYVIHMGSPDDYILQVQDAGGYHNEVWINNTEAVMEVPRDGEAGVLVEDISYRYMEEIGGSIFVAGGYTCTIGIDPSFKVAAVWRDGELKAEVWDDNDSDGMDYKNASMVGADFE